VKTLRVLREAEEELAEAAEWKRRPGFWVDRVQR
jgi:hypothetical protein